MNDENDAVGIVRSDRQILWDRLISDACDALGDDVGRPPDGENRVLVAIRELVVAFAGNAWVERLRRAADVLERSEEKPEARRDALFRIAGILAGMPREAPEISCCHR